MKKTTNEIVTQIRALLNELEGAPADASPVQESAVKTTPKKATGCIGAIQGLIDEDFFKTQKAISQVVDKLKEEGQPYSRELVSMNLLNLVKPPRKILRRIKENDQWQYIVRT
ncbi:MAG: hypothetical protein Q8Q38_01750 [bacterium]|nr:hypothetical protein [bacterium]